MPMAGGTTARLSLDEERRVRLARLCAAMREGEPPVQVAQAFHLYADESLYVVRPGRRMEYFGPEGAEGGPACFAPFGRPLFRGGGAGALIYMAPSRGEEELPSAREWQPMSDGRLHLTSVRMVFEGEDGGSLDFPFEAIRWTDCYADGVGVCAAQWAPMYFQTPYPEWLYAFFRYLSVKEVAEVRLAPELDQRARLLGL
jgi:hypothetical protein